MQPLDLAGEQFGPRNMIGTAGHARRFTTTQQKKVSNV
jgi:hypothetical protein